MNFSRPALHILYWLATGIFLATYISSRSGFSESNSWIILLILPICILCTYFINLFLFPRYLVKGKHVRFMVYFGYTIIVAFYIESLLLIFIYSQIADFDVTQANFNTFSVVVGMLLPIVGAVAIKTVRYFSLQNSPQTETSILLRVERRDQKVALEEIVYIEGLKDYVKVVLVDETLITKEKMKALESKLSTLGFIRVHKSYIVALDKVRSFNSKELETAQGNAIPIGNTYKNEFLEKMKSA